MIFLNRALLSLLTVCCCLKAAGAGFFSSSPGYFLSYPPSFPAARQQSYPLYFRLSGGSSTSSSTSTEAAVTRSAPADAAGGDGSGRTTTKKPAPHDHRGHDHRDHDHPHPPPPPRPTASKGKAGADDEGTTSSQQDSRSWKGTATLLNFERSSPSLYVSGKYPGIITAKSLAESRRGAAVPAPVVVRSRSYSFAPPDGLGTSASSRFEQERPSTATGSSRLSSRRGGELVSNSIHGF